MLVLTRQKNQSIVIGDEIEITIVDVRGDKVRVGIKAPDSVAIYRQEIYESIKAANIEAASADLDGASQVAKLFKAQPKKPAEKTPGGEKGDAPEKPEA